MDFIEDQDLLRNIVLHSDCGTRQQRKRQVLKSMKSARHTSSSLMLASLRNSLMTSCLRSMVIERNSRPSTIMCTGLVSSINHIQMLFATTARLQPLQPNAEGIHTVQPDKEGHPSQSQPPRLTSAAPGMEALVQLSFSRANPRHGEAGREHEAAQPLPGCLEAMLQKNLMKKAKRDGLAKVRVMVGKDPAVLKLLEKQGPRLRHEFEASCRRAAGFKRRPASLRTAPHRPRVASASVPGPPQVMRFSHFCRH